MTFRILLVAAVVAIATPTQAQDAPMVYRVGQLAVVTFNATDGLSTVFGWHRGQYETNPIIGQHVGRLVGVKVASTVAQLALMHVLRKTGHPTAAGWIGLGAATVPAYATQHNVRLLK